MGAYTDSFVAIKCYDTLKVNAILNDVQRLPHDPANNCQPDLPWNFVRTNTIFGVVHQAGGYTAWSDKHPAYASVSGPSTKGPVNLDDFYAPEINAIPVAFPGIKPGGQNICNPINGIHTATTRRSAAVQLQLVEIDTFFVSRAGAGVTVKARFSHQRFRLQTCPAEQHRTATFLQLIRKFLKRCDACRIDGGHVAQSQDHNWGKRCQMVRDGVDLVGHPEQKCPRIQ